MRQVVQNIRNGQLRVVDSPGPAVQAGQLLVANRCSIISAGTEKMARDLARKSLLNKARQRPDHVRRVIEKVRNEGLMETVRQVRDKLDQPMTMGYSSAGIVLACGHGVHEFQPGDRVASNAPHAEVVTVPKRLVGRIPDEVDYDQAAFAVLGAIAMQGVRLSRTTIGETAFVIGLGLIGQLTVSLLKSAGVRVIATDLESSKCELALKMGADVARPRFSAQEVESLTGELGADSVLITASTSSNEPIDLAAATVRQKGRVVLVGVVGLELDRRPFYFKEAEFVVSCSYGPGRYDPLYEEQGQDYPASYVRWTEQRNIQSVLDLMATGQLDVSPLVSHRFAIDDAEQAYDLIENGTEPYLGILLQYPESTEGPKQQIHLTSARPHVEGDVGIGCLGAGNFARAVLLPKLCSLPRVRPEVICSAGGLSATTTGEKYGFRSATTDEANLLNDEKVHALIVATRHDQHARQVIAGLRAGKHVFVEKPLCLTLEKLAEIEQVLLDTNNNRRQIMVGFNRRFSPAAQAVRAFYEQAVEPLTVSIRFNAGAIPADHWVQDENIGGGRIVGEACHAIDLATYLTGSVVTRVFAESIGSQTAPQITDDQCFVTLRHANGSVSNVAYLAGGDRACPKERIEVFGGGKTAIIDDFRLAECWSGGRRKRLWRGKQDKGHTAELASFVDAIVSGKPGAIPWAEIAATSAASILAVRSLREAVPLDVGPVCNSVSESVRRAG